MPNKEKEKIKKEKRIRPTRERFPKLSKRDTEILDKELERNIGKNPGVPPDRTYESWPYPTGGS